MRSLKMVAAALALAVLAACGGGGSGSAGSGTLAVALTDASCGIDFDEVNITVNKVRVHRSASVGEGAAGWNDIEIDPPRKINLLTLLNGVLEELGQTALPAGQYTQVRLVLERNTGADPFKNSVVPTGGAEQSLDTPSGIQSGIKLIHPFTVEPDEVKDLVLDFDACRSVVSRGNGTYGLKPVIRPMPGVPNGIAGFVDLTLTGVVVSAQKDGVVIRQTVPNSVGRFLLSPIDPAQSTYDVVITATDHAPAVVTGVTVAADTTTQISTTAIPIALPASATRVVDGMVAPAGAAPTVRALQTIDGFTVEVAYVNADDIDGTYSLTLPIDAPVRAPYALPLPLVFLPAASAGQYTIEAAATGYATDSDTVDLSSGNATKNFVLSVAP
ncbi:MAG: DUF4382 domain-containing protein [Burkholderiales bacterium]